MAGRARVIVEKPFSRDLASARALNRPLRSVFAPDAIFRIDHFPGKEAIMNILYFPNHCINPLSLRERGAWFLEFTVSELQDHTLHRA